jgi:(2Fe-2S) ferredoxin
MVKSYRYQVFVCTASGTGAEMQTAADPCRNRFCSDKGGEAIRAHFWTALEAAGVYDVKVTRMGCTVQHARGPIVIVYPDGIWYAGVTIADVDEIVRDHLMHARPVERLVLHRMDADGPHKTGEGI